MVAKIWPTKPSGVQLSTPIVPPGRQTRSSSSAATWWWGANITPMHEMTVSNAASSYGSASASAVAHSIDRSSAAAAGSPDREQLGGQVGGDRAGAHASRAAE